MSTDGFVPVATRPEGWLVDPLDATLERFWDGQRWTFHTRTRAVAGPAPAEPAQPSVPQQRVEPPGLRPDIEAAMHAAHGSLIGARKEIKLLADYLEPEETVLALCSAQGQGTGVLACTNTRLIFLFVGLVQRQIVEARWRDARAMRWYTDVHLFEVYNVARVTKKSVPILSVKVDNVDDVERVASAAIRASDAPRIEIA